MHKSYTLGCRLCAMGPQALLEGSEQTLEITQDQPQQSKLLLLLYSRGFCALFVILFSYYSFSFSRQIYCKQHEKNTRSHVFNDHRRQRRSLRSLWHLPPAIDSLAIPFHSRDPRQSAPAACQRLSRASARARCAMHCIHHSRRASAAHRRRSPPPTRRQRQRRRRARASAAPARAAPRTPALPPP